MRKQSFPLRFDFDCKPGKFNDGYLQGPGQFFAFDEVNREANKFVEFEFHEETVVTGMIVTTYKDFGMKRFRLRANNDLNSPQLLTVREPVASVVSSELDMD